MLPPLAPLPRLAAAGACWLLLFLATPGILGPDGSLALAALALVPWAAFCARPGRKAFLVEWLAAAVGLSAQTYWSTYVLWITLLAMALVPAVYMAVAGAVLRRLAVRWPLVVAAPAAWIGLETLRYLVEPPFGLGWMRLGHFAHATPWLVGGMRVVGVGGVGFALAAFAGGAADVLRARLGGVRLPLRPAPLLALGLGPIALVALAGALTAPPPTVDGPRVLLVQPGFEQARKMRPPSAREIFEETLARTREGLADAARQGVEPDLVAWGETIFPWPLAAPDALEAWDRGARPPAWGSGRPDREDLTDMRETERAVVAGVLYGAGPGERVLPPGTLFLTGVEQYIPRDGEIRRSNALVAFGEGGRRLGHGTKVHLVPGGETMEGLERFGWVRATAHALAGYVPDLVGDPRVGVVDLPLRDGRTLRAGLSVCFDNAFDGPYAEPTRRGPLDLHLVVSNEAWYRESFEYDQMMAFSRCAAAFSGRSMVRATNAGVTAVVGPDGREVARLRDPDGRDRMVAGALLCTVPVPAGAAGPTPYARLEPVWQGAWIALGALLLLLRRRGYSPAPGG